MRTEIANLIVSETFLFLYFYIKNRGFYRLFNADIKTKNFLALFTALMAPITNFINYNFYRKFANLPLPNFWVLLLISDALYTLYILALSKIYNTTWDWDRNHLLTYEIVKVVAIWAFLVQIIAFFQTRRIISLSNF